MKKVKTTFLIEEIPTDGHSPLKFLCDDGNIYYCKYRVNWNKQEIDCLIYEVVCSILLQNLNIPTPNIALVEISDGSYDKRDTKRNKQHIKSGLIYFGSQEIQNAQLVTELVKVSNLEDFNQYSNPNDLIRIALFDLWIGNTDRGKGNKNYEPGRSNNYNLLMNYIKDKNQIIAFDHGFAFDGENGLRIFNEKFMPSTNGKLFGTSFFIDILKHISIEEKQNTINQFISHLKSLNIPLIMSQIFQDLPSEWIQYPLLKDKIIKYLKSEERLVKLSQIAKNEILDK